MDERKAKCKALRKAYVRKKRRTLTLWKVLIVLSILFGGLLLCAKLLPAKWLLAALGQLTVRLYAPVVSLGIWVALGVCGVVFLSAVIAHSVQAHRLKRTEEYLNWRTMKRALQDEKAYQ